MVPREWHFMQQQQQGEGKLAKRNINRFCCVGVVCDVQVVARAR
jgi:hypothetical protein